MAINKNHEFEDLDGIKCAIVEKNASQERVQFLKDLLIHNKYEVVVTSPAPKAAPPTSPSDGNESIDIASTKETVPPVTFTIGVTDLTFNPTNAVFGRLLKTTDDHVVTLAYWQQKESVSHDEIPYYENK